MNNEIIIKLSIFEVIKLFLDMLHMSTKMSEWPHYRGGLLYGSGLCKGVSYYQWQFYEVLTNSFFFSVLVLNFHCLQSLIHSIW